MSARDILTKKTLREFGIIFGLLFPIFIGFIVPLISGHDFKEWTIWIGLAFISFGISIPSILYYPYKVWMKIGYLLGLINSKIVLGIIFFLILQPIALIMKLFKYDPLRKKLHSNISYKENKQNHKTDFKRIF